MFLHNICGSLKHHIVMLRRQHLSREQFFIEITALDVEKPQNIAFSKKSVLAITPKEDDTPLAKADNKFQNISLLKRRIADLESMLKDKEVDKPSDKKKKVLGSKFKCYKCGKQGHIAKNCRRPKKIKDTPKQGKRRQG